MESHHAHHITFYLLYDELKKSWLSWISASEILPRYQSIEYHRKASNSSFSFIS
jgi:hypothetical protein